MRIYQVITKTKKVKTYRYQGNALNFWYKEYQNDWVTASELNNLFDKTFFTCKQTTTRLK